MTDLNKIVDELSKLTVVEAADLSKKLEKEWGVSPVAPVAVAPAAGAAPQVEEKTNFVVFLAAVGDKKINVIKEVRAITGLGLRKQKIWLKERRKKLKKTSQKKKLRKLKRN